MRPSRPWLPYVLLATALLLLVLYEAGVLGPLENFLGLIVAPVERALSTLITNVGDLFKTVRDVRELQQQVDELQRANDALRVENIRLREQYMAENEQLRALLNFQSESPTFSIVGADIIERGCEVFPCGDVLGEDTNPYLNYLVINVGTRDGVAVGMPAVSSGAALVGRVARVTPNLAFVQLINDPESQIAAMLQGSRVLGMVEGRRDGSLIMTDILPDETVEENEIVITSGLGGLLPRGLILGQVETVTYQESALFQEAVIRPALDFRRLEVVVIITDFERPPVEELEESP
ncbi:MAG: rod shape-determining protein MreC [Anaerolineae bacterium]